MPSTPRTNSELEAYFRRFLAPTGAYIHVNDADWGQDKGPAFLARSAAELDLMVGLAGVTDLLTWQEDFRDSVDLYVSDFSIYRNAFAWLMDRAPLHVMPNDRDAPTLRSLLTLPVLRPGALARLTVRDLVDIRDEQIFRDWRGSLAGALSLAAVTAQAGGEPEREFARQMLKERERVLRRARSVKFLQEVPQKGASFGIDVITSALAAGVTNSAMGGRALDAAAVAAASALGLRPLAAALRGVRSDRQGAKSAERHFALFASDG